MKEKEYWVKHLGLEPHPEGGFFKETYRSKLSQSFQGFESNRNVSTGIYFLLESGNFSAFHRIKSDEMWHFYYGDPLRVHIIFEDGTYQFQDIGREPENGMKLQFVVPANCWFASEVKPRGKYSLVGCTVAPRFDFEDFELAGNNLITQFPAHRSIIDRLIRE